MEDRYLFKAKCFEKWHIGNIVKEPDGLYIRDIKENVMAYIDDESTICQCTGLKDKNGKLIWENDVVKCLYNCYGEKYVYIGKVIYKEGTCRFVVANSKSTDYEWWNEEKEVIGNIFDNPELLESEE